ncbi:MAG: TatD family hydrolase, partial [Patescibacteria group bacterium]
IVAIGEIGLDYFKAKISHDEQKEAFRKQLQLAVKVGLPVIVHNREADEECLEILLEFAGDDVVFHCFGSNLEFARKVWSAGFMTSFTGIITYPNAVGLREVVKEVPMDKFMVETDCPYLAPQAYRGKRNEPAYVTEVAKMIAEVKGISVEEVGKVAVENSKRFFGF